MLIILVNDIKAASGILHRPNAQQLHMDRLWSQKQLLCNSSSCANFQHSVLHARP
jgi:hypothetical protein